MYLQKCEEYCGGDTFGINDNGELYKGIMCFMIIGLKNNVPYIIKTVPETKIEGEWIQNEILHCLQVLQDLGFKVRGIVCDDHSSNVSAFKKLLATYGSSDDDLAIEYNDQKVYLFFDVVHLMKNIRNNLLNRKRFLFPPFSFSEFYDEVKDAGGEVSWHVLHQVYERDQKLQANMRAAPKLCLKVLHPGSCKQSVSTALAIFHPTTSAAIKFYFPEKTDAAEFLNLIFTWWTISNSKTRFSLTHRLGNAAVYGDHKPEFLRAFAKWIDSWDDEKLRNCERFTLTAQTSYALRRTLRCHASLIDDLLAEGYDFVLTARFQTDPIERRFGQYRQMSGGPFLVSAKDVNCSEKIVKIKSLIKEGIDIDESVRSKETIANESEFISSVKATLDGMNMSTLTDDTKQVVNHVAGYIAKKAAKSCNDCCEHQLLYEGPSNSNGYIAMFITWRTEDAI